MDELLFCNRLKPSTIFLYFVVVWANPLLNSLFIYDCWNKKVLVMVGRQVLEMRSVEFFQCNEVVYIKQY